VPSPVVRYIAVTRIPTMIVTFPNTVLITEPQPPVIYADNDGNRHHADPRNIFPDTKTYGNYRVIVKVEPSFSFKVYRR